MATTCSQCKKHLTDPVSVERGMGPICWGRIQTIRELEESDKMEFIPEPMGRGIILERRDGKVATNVPWVCVNGSPDGYEWGYGGSGPSDLALNIVENILRSMGFKGTRSKCFKGECFNLAFALRFDFKVKFLAGIPNEGGVISFRDAKQWILNEVIKHNLVEEAAEYGYKTA